MRNPNVFLEAMRNPRVAQAIQQIGQAYQVINEEAPQLFSLVLFFRF